MPGAYHHVRRRFRTYVTRFREFAGREGLGCRPTDWYFARFGNIVLCILSISGESEVGDLRCEFGVNLMEQERV
jgi:hypothetical protein